MINHQRNHSVSVSEEVAENGHNAYIA